MEENRDARCLLMNCLPENLSFSSHYENLLETHLWFFFYTMNNDMLPAYIFLYQINILPFCGLTETENHLPQWLGGLFSTFSEHIWTSSVKMLSDLWQYLLWCLLGTDFSPDHWKQLQTSNKTGTSFQRVGGQCNICLVFCLFAWLHFFPLLLVKDFLKHFSNACLTACFVRF